jgi:hypothetical protein
VEQQADVSPPLPREKPRRNRPETEDSGDFKGFNSGNMPAFLARTTRNPAV